MSTPNPAPGPDKVLSKPTLTVSAAETGPANKTAAAKATLPKARSRTVMVCPVEVSKPEEKQNPMSINAQSPDLADPQ
jgi:hypothetical protein